MREWISVKDRLPEAEVALKGGEGEWNWRERCWDRIFSNCDRMFGGRK